ncbi:MAG TPA: amino acid ABC transporter permease [Clostridia bacterium]|nr:amino acid ABC transporter permease [Clostridia bacterium]
MDFFSGIQEVFTTQKYMLTIAEGLKTSAIITAGALVIGLFLGMLVATIKIAASRSKAMKVPAAICNLYIVVVRGTPIALQLFIMAFAVFAIRGFPLVVTAILTFGINSGAYVAENIRAGIQSVDIGQMEAGRSLGISYVSSMFRIVLPQAVKNVIPAIGNEVIALLKETSVVSMIGLVDLTFAAKIVGSGQNMADYLVPMSVAALFYLVIVYIFSTVIKLVERRFKKSDRNS